MEFLGTVIDSERFVFEAVPKKVTEVLALTRGAAAEARATGRVGRMALKVIAGKLGAMRLALPSARAWTREMLRCGGDGVGRAAATPELLQEFDHWIATLPRPERLMRPIRSAAAEAELRVDVSPAGWGAHVGFEERSGWIPAAYVGHSSTARELAALQCAAEAFRERVAGRRLRVVMDSRAAVCNLTKEGGPVRELCAIVKEWARWCEHHDVRPVYEWVPRVCWGAQRRGGSGRRRGP